MALKDWKKISSGYWNRIGGIWWNKLTDEEIVVNKNEVEFYDSKYDFAVYPPKKTKSFKTKSQSLKFAKNYMRKH